MKKCSKCGELKPGTKEFFYANNRAADGLKYKCKSCCASQFKSWSVTNKDRRNDYYKAYKAANPEKEAVWLKNKYERHKQEIIDRMTRWKKANPDKMREHNKRYGERHPEQIKARTQKRRAIKRNASGEHSATDIKNQLERQGGKCYYCRKCCRKSYHVDHVTPLSKGGSNGPENIVIACAGCNLSKGAKMPHEFAGILL